MDWTHVKEDLNKFASDSKLLLKLFYHEKNSNFRFLSGLSKKTTCLRGRVAEINFGLMSTNVNDSGRSRKVLVSALRLRRRQA